MKKLFIFLYIIIQSYIMYGQQPDDKTMKYWFDAGVGSYICKSSGGVNWNTSINFINKKSLFFKARYLNLQEFSLEGPNPSEYFSSGGIMIGKVFLKKYGHCAFLCGIGETGGMKRGKFFYESSDTTNNIIDIMGDLRVRHYEKNYFNSISIPLEVELQFKPIKYVGIGISFFGDLNLKRPMCGFLFKIGLGKLR